jgi:hypothetical protein
MYDWRERRKDYEIRSILLEDEKRQAAVNLSLPMKRGLPQDDRDPVACSTRRRSKTGSKALITSELAYMDDLSTSWRLFPS